MRTTPGSRRWRISSAQAYAAHVPLVGICFGHQIIAQAMGGKVERYAGGWAVGADRLRFRRRNADAERLASGSGDRKCPQGAKVIATNDFCDNAALLYDDRALDRAGPSRIPARLRRRADEDPRARVWCPTR